MNSEQNIDTLYIELGGAIAKNLVGGRPLSDAEKIAIGRNWYRDKLDTIRQGICHKEAVQKYLKSDEARETSDLVSVVSDFITANFSGVPVAIVTHLTIRYGLSKLCGKYND